MNSVSSLQQKVNIHAVWLSDIHLGYKDCKAKFLLQFLDAIETRHLYLVGDIIDVWSLSRQFHWPPEHNQVLRKLLKMAKDGVHITYIPGNHDSSFREYCGEAFGSIQIARQAVHTTRLGYGYWSLATYIKGRLANAAQVIDVFETAAINKAAQEGYDGIVCGHIHHPNVIERRGIIYCNDGDWVENCTTLVEKNDGVLEIWHWSDQSRCLKRLNGEIVESDMQQLDLLKAG